MELEYIRIHALASYEAGYPGYKGEVKYNTGHGNVEIRLDAQLSSEVLKLVADSLTRATKDLANSLTASVFEAAGQALEDKS